MAAAARIAFGSDQDMLAESREVVAAEGAAVGGRLAVLGRAHRPPADGRTVVHGGVSGADGAPPIALPTGDYALSDRTRRDVDLAAMTLAREAYRRARALLAANRNCLDDLVANALERETLTREDLDEIFAAHVLDETAADIAEAGAEDTSR